MNERKVKQIYGAMNHDIGKVVFRSGEGGNHSRAGYEFLKNRIGIEDAEILDQIRCHHGKYIAHADLPDDSLAYITYIADNIASGADRKKVESEDEEASAQLFDKTAPLASVFNILNGNNAHLFLNPGTLDPAAGINYPSEQRKEFSMGEYIKIREHMADSLKSIEVSEKYVNSLMELYEADCSYVPSSTMTSELMDISLYDHSKLTAAAACCILDYLTENDQTNYREILFEKADTFYKEKAFLLYSIDMSGIQDFIYTISSKRALKGLRARSFYLEIMLEHIIDELLTVTDQSRANLIYAGGGHAYILLPNTERVKDAMEKAGKTINGWLLTNFGTALYMAYGYVECSADDLKNKPAGSYGNLFISVSDILAVKKNHRYNSEQLKWLNTRNLENVERECVVCKRSDHLNEDGECSICSSLNSMSNDILNKDFFAVMRNTDKTDAMILPYIASESEGAAESCYLIAADEITLRDKISNKPDFVRSYSKNKQYTGANISTKLWVGDYHSASEFEQLARAASGIKRLGVIRADVDNLGNAFVSGFENETVGDRYVSLSRTATFSRQLSMFFKLHINGLLKNGVCRLDGGEGVKERNAVIVYSGGDDVFIVGAWDDVVGFAVDLKNALKKYSAGTLTLSAGIGIYSSHYPISAMAHQTGTLEDLAKKYESEPNESDGTVKSKNAVALFEDDKKSSFSWDDFEDNVLNEKYRVVKHFFEQSTKGKNYLYNILDYLRNINKEKINIARYAYLISRVEPEGKVTEKQRQLQTETSKKMYNWMIKLKSRYELIMALYIYTYFSRERTEEQK